MKRNLVLLILLFGVYDSSRAAPKQEPKLPVLAILEFKDQANRPEYKWVADSLRSEITGRMRENFEFKEPPAKKTDAAATREFKTTKGLKNKAKLAAFCKKQKLDMIIFGSYLGQKKNLNIDTNLYVAASNEIIVNSNVDVALTSNMFASMADIADEVTESIYDYALEQDEKARQAEDKNQEARLVIKDTAKNKERQRKPRKSKSQAGKQFEVFYEGYGVGLFGAVGFGYSVTENIQLNLRGIFLPKDFISERDHFSFGIGGGYYFFRNFSAVAGGLLYSRDVSGAVGGYAGAAYDFVFGSFVIRPAVYFVLTSQHAFPYAGLSGGYRF